MEVFERQATKGLHWGEKTSISFLAPSSNAAVKGEPGGKAPLFAMTALVLWHS